MGKRRRRPPVPRNSRGGSPSSRRPTVNQARPMVADRGAGPAGNAAAGRARRPALAPSRGAWCAGGGLAPTRKNFDLFWPNRSQVAALRPGPRSGGEATAAVGATGTAEAVKPWRSRYRSPPPRQPRRRWRSGSGRSSTPMTSPPSGRRSTSCELARSPSFHPPIPSSPEFISATAAAFSCCA